MALRWSDITIYHDRKPWRGGSARKWVADNLAPLLEGEDGISSVVTLHVDGALLTGQAALTHLKGEVERLHGRLHSSVLPRPRRDAQPPVRREAVNVLRPATPIYTIELTLGNIDALFAPIGGGDPWTELGVQQRLQALGYLYTPLDHPSIAVHAKHCWSYYKRVHNETDGPAKLSLVEEINGNLLARAFPGSDTTFDASVLPAPSPDGIAPEQNAILRFPGAYATTKHSVSHLNGGDHELNGHARSVVDGKYLAGIGDPRQKIEKEVFADNPLMGKLPLLARVTATYEDQRTEVVAGVPVYFQLRPPTPLPDDSPFLAPAPPDKVMNYDLVGAVWNDDTYSAVRADNGGLNEAEWRALHRLTRRAYAENLGGAQAKADEWITTWATLAPVAWASVQAWWGRQDDEPYVRLTTSNAAALNGQIDVALNASRLDAAAKKPGALSGLVSAEEWVALRRLALAALDAHANDVALARPTARGWVETWAAGSSPVLANVAGWWGNAPLPYPRLRPNMANNAKAEAARILAAREAGQARVAELAGVGQKKFIDDFLAAEEARNGDQDPQKKNASADPHGGKARHADGIKAVLETPAARRDGFHTPRDGQLPDTGTLELATLPDDAVTHPHAVKCVTNAKGMAGTLFMPSRVGGDAYRLRAYIDPAWLLLHGPVGEHQASAETGTMVVWRNLRIHRYLRMETPPADGYSLALTGTLNEAAVNKIGAPMYQKMFLGHPIATVPVLPSLQNEATYEPNLLGEAKRGSKGEQMMYRPVRVTPRSLEEQLKWAYCELIADCAGPETIDDAIRTTVAATARRAMAASGRITTPVDWDKLIFVDHTSPFLLNLRSFVEYNALVTDPPFPFLVKDAANQDVGTAMDWAWEAIAEELSGGGVLPGLTLIQIPRGDTWDFRALDVKTTITSGYGTAARAAFLSHTEGVYRGFFAYAATANALHELGHVLGLAHQPPAGADLVAAHQPPVTAPFTKPDVAGGEAVCLMSYSGCYGDYCGACILALRGFFQTHVNTL